MPSLFLEVARLVLERVGRPLTAREIVDEGKRLDLFSDALCGKTPQQTMKSKLSVNIRRFGASSDFARTEPGKFTLRAEAVARNLPLHDAAPARKSLAEDVLVFATEDFPPPRFQGIRSNWRPFLNDLRSRDAFRYLPRIQAELSDNYKQVLTYVLVTKSGRVLAYDRGSYTTADSFLRGRSCIGFGGHASIQDRTLFTQSDFGIVECATRELAEELKMPQLDRDRLAQRKVKLVGILNDDSSPNGRRHVAFVLRYEVSHDHRWTTPTRGEQSITNLRWLLPGDLIDLTRFEYWSQLCIREFFPELYSAQSSYRIIRRANMRPPQILAVTGPIAAGKTIASETLVELFGYTAINTGRLLARALGMAPVDEASRLVFQEAAQEYITSPAGPVQFANVIADEIARAGNPERIVLDGVRQPATIAALRRQLERRVGILHVETPIDLAFSFYRSRFGGNIPFDEFIAVRNSPVESAIPELSRSADAVIYNRAGKTAYNAALRQLMAALSIDRHDAA